MILQQGRPVNSAGRLEKEIRVYDELDHLEIHYQRVDHEPAMTIEACEAIEPVLGGKICKNLFLCNRQKTDFYLLMMPGDKNFRTKDLSAQIGSSRLSFGDAEHMEALLDITPGSLSVLGLFNDHDHRVRLLIDEELKLDDTICCHPCINTSTLRILTTDVLQKVIPATGHEIRFVSLPRTELI